MGEFCGADLLWTPETAELVKTEMRRSLGGCPCELGGPCPLLPRDMSEVLPSGKEPEPPVKLCRTLTPQQPRSPVYVRVALATTTATLLVGAATLSPAAAHIGRVVDDYGVARR